MMPSQRPVSVLAIEPISGVHLDLDDDRKADQGDLKLDENVDHP